MAYPQRLEDDLVIAPGPGPMTVVGAGAAAGILAGIVMSAVAAATAARAGMDPWQPFRAVAAALYGPIALVEGVETAAVGLAIRLAASAALGVAFAFLIGGRPASSIGMVLGGLAFGVGAWALETFAVLPSANPTLSARVALRPGSWLVEHLAFGVTVAALFGPLTRPSPHAARGGRSASRTP